MAVTAECICWQITVNSLRKRWTATTLTSRMSRKMLLWKHATKRNWPFYSVVYTKVMRLIQHTNFDDGANSRVGIKMQWYSMFSSTYDAIVTDLGCV